MERCQSSENSQSNGNCQNKTNNNAVNVVFVCTGNTCRSCMAEGILRAVSQKEEMLSQLGVSSRGIQAFDGDPASEHSIAALKKLWNIDISIHKAKLLGQEDMQRADIVLTMTRQHREFLRMRYPDKKSRIFTLKEYAYPKLAADSAEVDISDPYGMPYMKYETCALEIYDSVQEVIKRLNPNESEV